MNKITNKPHTPKQAWKKIRKQADRATVTINILIEKHFSKLKRIPFSQQQGQTAMDLRANIKALSQEQSHLSLLRMRALDTAIAESGIIKEIEDLGEEARVKAREIKVLTARLKKFSDAVGLVTKLVSKIALLV